MQANRNSGKGRLVMTLFRFGQVLPRQVRRIYKPIYYVLVDVLMGISIPIEARIGGGFILRHGQGVVISWLSTIGDDCEVHQHVTLGEKDGASPQLGNHVMIGDNAVLLGGIRVGDGASIGAGAVVTKNAPVGGTAVGPAATIWT
jgi:serine O-acetyltransferase